MKVGLYGGSFNPIHYGHLNVARTAMADLALDRLIVLPANVSPFKTDGVGAAEAEGLWDRLELVKAAFADDPRVTVDDRELRRGGVSYAIDTVREIRAEYAALAGSDAGEPLRLFFIIGEDSVAGLPRWKEIDALRQLVTFKAYPRTKESSTEIRRLFADARVTVNPDAALASVVRAGVVRKNGFCPCRLPKDPAFFCPCDEFKDQLRDRAYHGLCHCRLYLKP